MIRLSLITVTYNAEPHLADCLRSISSQGGHGLQHILVDAKSEDRTLEIQDELGIPGALVISEKDRGIYDGMNKGITLAGGDIIGILNSDDVYAHSEVLSKVVRVFEDPKIDGCYGDLVYVDKDNLERVVRYWRAGEYSPRKMYSGWMVPHPTLFLRREIYNTYGGFCLELGTAADYEIMVRLIVKNQIRLQYLPEVLVKMRSGGASNTSLGSRIAANRMDRLAWKRNGISPFPWTLMLKPLRKVPQWWQREKIS